MPTTIPTSLVNTPHKLHCMLSFLTHMPYKPPSLYFDLEGAPLSRDGSISIVSLYVRPHHRVYIIDVHVLGSLAFTLANPVGGSIKSILESVYIPKIFFDVRKASDALYNLYGINLRFVRDLQIMEISTRTSNHDKMSALAMAVVVHSGLSNADQDKWVLAEYTANRLINPEKGGSYEVLNQRPFVPEIVEYCGQKAGVLPRLYDLYNDGLSTDRFWNRMAREATFERIRATKAADYDEEARTNTDGPWDEMFIQDTWEKYAMFGTGFFDVQD